MQSLTVQLGDRSYPILIGSGLLADGTAARYLQSSQALVVTNPTVAELYLEPVVAALEGGGRRIDTLVLPEGEAYKTLDTVRLIYDRLMEGRHHRSTTVIALGGGVIGDMAGFAAATYQRGCNFIQLPTTLLAQVDSSVGGKTGVNHPQGKNMIGAFYQPRAVVIDVDTLQTLPDRERAAGLAEVIKYGLIADADFFRWLEANISTLRRGEPEPMVEAIHRSCAIKAAVVGEDETEQGRRAILNLGHTFGHAIEAAQGYGEWLHGEAVGAGMVMALDLSQRLGWIDADIVERGRALIAAAGLPVQAPAGMTGARFRQLMGMDKKVRDGRLRLVLIERLGHAVVTDEFADASLEQTLQSFCEA